MSDDRPIDKIFPFMKKTKAAGKCIPSPIGCGGDASSFRDELSKKEFQISGLCQKCQDEIFKEEE